jgi:HEAT repeat protein
MRHLLLATGILACAVSLPALADPPPGGADSSGGIQAWIAKLDSADAAERIAAIEAIGKLQSAGSKAVPALLARLDDESAEVRAAAAAALGGLGAEVDQVAAALIGHFTDEGGIVRQAPKLEYVPLWAIYGEAAGGLGQPAVDPLIRVLGSDSPQVASAAAIALGRIGEPAAKATPQLIEMLASPDDWRRHAAASALRGIGPAAAAAVPALRKAVHHENFHTQYWACRALGGIGAAAAAATPDLLEVMKSGGASVRRNAAAALGNIGPAIGEDAVLRLVEAMQRNGIEALREEAVVALGKLKPFAETTVPAIQKTLKDPTFDSDTQAARSLWLLTGKADSALPVLIECLGDLTYVQPAIDVLGEMGPEAAPAVDKLIEILGALDPDDRIAAAWCLGQIGPAAQKASGPLRKLLDNKEPKVREAARGALERISK